jgi:hypothetical protein
MASGSFPVTTKNQYISGKVEWSSVPNTAGNYSDVTATLRLSRTNTGYTTYGNGSFTMIINGDSKTNSGHFTFTYNSNTLCVSHTVRVYHNTDGTKSTTITVYGSLPNTTLQMPSQSKTITLDTIPRASSIATFNNFTIGSDIPITINRASSSFTHTLELKYGSTSIATRTGIGASTTLVLTETEQDRLYKAMANVTSGTVTLYCTTYSNGKKIGSTASKTATATVGSNIKPDFTTITHSDVRTDIKNVFGVYIQGKSYLNLAITGATGAKYSTIKGYKIEFNQEVYNSRTAISGYIKNSGTLTIKGTVTDSRGRTATKTVNITVYAYSKPKITSFRADRCNADGSLNESGAYVRVRGKCQYSSINNKNTGTLRIYSKTRNVGNYSLKKTDSATPSFDFDYVISGYEVTKSYDFQAVISDYFESADSTLAIGTAAIILDLGKHGVGINKFREEEALDVGGGVIGTRFLVRNSDGSYTTIKKDGSVAIGIGSPLKGDTAGANIQFYHDGRIRSHGELAVYNYMYQHGNNPVASLDPEVLALESHTRVWHDIVGVSFYYIGDNGTALGYPANYGMLIHTRRPGSSLVFQLLYYPNALYCRRFNTSQSMDWRQLV